MYSATATPAFSPQRKVLTSRHRWHYVCIQRSELLSLISTPVVELLVWGALRHIERIPHDLFYLEIKIT